MSITAMNLMFSPFGRNDSSSSSSEAHQEHEMVHAGHETSLHGQAKSEMTFSDDEIPF
jgi:hypothetical protein